MKPVFAEIEFSFYNFKSMWTTFYFQKISRKINKLAWTHQTNITLDCYHHVIGNQLLSGDFDDEILLIKMAINVIKSKMIRK